MQLRDYLSENGITQKDFAERIGITPEYMSRIMNGATVPSKHIRAHIELETGGTVRQDWAAE